MDWIVLILAAVIIGALSGTYKPKRRKVSKIYLINIVLGITGAIYGMLLFLFFYNDGIASFMNNFNFYGIIIGVIFSTLIIIIFRKSRIIY